MLKDWSPVNEEMFSTAIFFLFLTLFMHQSPGGTQIWFEYGGATAKSSWHILPILASNKGPLKHWYTKRVKMGIHDDRSLYPLLHRIHPLPYTREMNITTPINSIWMRKIESHSVTIPLIIIIIKRHL